MKGDKIREFIINFILHGGGDPDITLNGLYQKSRIRLIITTVCINNNKIYYMDHISHPELKLRDAILMSSSIPGIFPPVEYNGRLYIDSGIVINNPIHILSDDAWGICEDKTCEVEYSAKVGNVFEYMLSLVNTIYNNMNTSSVTNSHQKLIKVKSDRVSVTSFNLTKDVKFSLFKNGVIDTKYQINHMILQESLSRKFY